MFASVMRLGCISWLAALVCLIGPDARAQVYRCIDSGGRTEYRATPCPNEVRGQPMPAAGTDSLKGSAASDKASPPSTGRDTYELSWEELTVKSKGTGPATAIPLPTSFPSFSWPTGVAHDTDLDIVTVVTMGAEGYLYRYDARRKQWLDYRSMREIDVRSIAYDARRKLYVARTDSGSTLLISNQGKLLQGEPRPGSASPDGSRSIEEPVLGAPITPRNEPQLAISPPPPSPQLAAGAELVVVSGHEPTLGVARVRLNRPGRRVLLVLSSHEKILWRVEATAGTTVVGVLLASVMNDSGVIADKQLPVHRVQFPFAPEPNHINFRKMLQQLNALFGVTKIDIFKGSYQVPALLEIGALNPAHADLTLQGVAATRPRSVFSFEMLTRDLRKESIRNDGVSASRQNEHLFAGSKTVLTRPGGQAYRLSDTGLQLIQTKSGQAQPLPMPPQFPELSWPTAVAYDDSQDIVAVASMGGEGFLYRFDVERQRWLDYQSLDNFDITSLAYEPNGKRYVGWTSDGSLVYVSNRGKVLKRKRLAELMPGLGYLYDRGELTAPVLLLAPLGSQTALVHLHDDKVSMIWTYDETTEQAQLTYRRPMVTSEKPQPLR
jgi:hypothetical protein